MKVIAISGHAMNGKDTAAEMIRSALELNGERVLITHYADLLKYICKMFFGWNGEKDERGRNLLQYVGTDVVRKKKPDFWVEFIIFILEHFGDNWDYVIIPDTRFPNEIDRLIEDGFCVTHIRIDRNNFNSELNNEQKTHESETALDKTTPDYLIKNSGSLQDLENNISKWVKEYLNAG